GSSCSRLVRECRTGPSVDGRLPGECHREYRWPYRALATRPRGARALGSVARPTTLARARLRGRRDRAERSDRPLGGDLTDGCDAGESGAPPCCVRVARRIALAPRLSRHGDRALCPRGATRLRRCTLGL